MPSDHDDSSGTGRFSSPGSTTHEIRGGAAGQPAADAHPDGASGCRWLVNYMADCMAAGGVDVVTARRLAGEMQPAIVSAFSTLARLDRAADPFNIRGGV
jgi:hypothetical protein